MYDRIVQSPPVNRGKKSKTFNIPPELWDGLPNVQGQVSIQAAFRCPDWTLVFVDHNVMLTFHVMALRRPCTPEDLIPGSIVSSSNFFIYISSSIQHLFILALEPYLE